MRLPEEEIWGTGAPGISPLLAGHFTSEGSQTKALATYRRTQGPYNEDILAVGQL